MTGWSAPVVQPGQKWREEGDDLNAFRRSGRFCMHVIFDNMEGIVETRRMSVKAFPPFITVFKDM